MLEKGRLYFLNNDGTKKLVYLSIKQNRLLFGSSEYCTVRIYIDGILSKHCILTIEDQEKAYLKPLHSLAYISLNNIEIKGQICLKDNDVITIFTKKFQFTYPSKCLPSRGFVERPLNLKRNWKISHPLNEAIPNINYIPKKRIFIIDRGFLKKIHEGFLKLTHYEPKNISYFEIKTKLADSFDNSLLIYKNLQAENSFELRRNVALCLFKFLCFIKELLNKNNGNTFDLLPLLKSIWKCSIARVREDMLFLPLKTFYFMYLDQEAAYKKYFQSTIHSCSTNVSLGDVVCMSEKNQCIKVNESYNSKCQGNSKHEGQKQNQDLQKGSSFSYKKRVSLAVKRYHLRRKKSIMMSNSAKIESDGNLELSDGKPLTESKSMINNSDEHNVVFNPKKETVKAKRKQRCKENKQELQDKTLLEIDLNQESQKTAKDDLSGEHATSKALEIQTKKRSYKGKKKKAPTNKIGESSQEGNQEMPDSRRITRSMAKNLR